MAERVDELDVQQAVLAPDDRRAVARHLDDRRTLCCSNTKSIQRDLGIGHRLALALQPLGTGEDAVRRKDLEPGILGRDEHDEHLRARRRPLLLVVGERGLVAMVAVRDQELLVVERAHDRGIVEPPEARAFDREVGFPLRRFDRRRPVVEEEDRLELDAGRAQEPEPPFLWAGMRALVRQNRAVLVRLDLQRGHDSTPAPFDPVGTDVVLDEQPDRRRLLDEHALGSPALECLRRLLLGVRQRQVDDVVRVLEVLRALLGGDHVVRRRHERLQRARLRLVVAQRAKGLDDRHRREPIYLLDSAREQHQRAGGGPGRRGRLRRRAQAAAADEEGRGVPLARARRPDGADRGTDLERRRAARRSLRRGRCRARARPRLEVRGTAAAGRPLGRGGRRGSRRADAQAAPRCRRARWVPRVPRGGDLARRAGGGRASLHRRLAAPNRAPHAPGRPRRTIPTRAACSSTRSGSRRLPEKPRSSTRACAQICSSRPPCSTTSDELASWVGRRRSGRPRRGACSATSTWACG